MPAHVTLLIPFVAPQSLNSRFLDELSLFFAEHDPFGFELRETGQFPGVLYIRPDPVEPFRALTLAIAGRYPDYPPYGGVHDDIRPHLTVGRLLGEADFTILAAAFAPAAQAALPITARASQVTLVDNTSGRWEQRASFALRT